MVPSLNDIVQYELPPLFRHEHFRVKPKIGIFGLPGGGKTTLLAVISMLDFQVQNEPCWSNINIKYDFQVSDEAAARYNLEGGNVVFEAQPLDMAKLYRMDESYRLGLVAIDEINVQVADAYKTQSNVNFYFNQVDQQFRKDGNGLIYTSIHEMWVDPRVRDITDIMIKCKDTARKPEGIEARKQEGVDIEFWVYPITDYLNGKTYAETREKLGPYYLHAKQWWGIFDTYQKQATGQKYARDIFKSTTPLEVGENQLAIGEYSEWGWLYDKIQELKDLEIGEVTSQEMWQFLEPYTTQVGKYRIGAQLRRMGLKTKGNGSYRSPLRYIIPDFDLEEAESIKKLSVGVGD